MTPVRTRPADRSSGRSSTGYNCRPRPPYVYMLRFERPHLLYVGMTADLRRHVDQQRHGRTRVTAGQSPGLVWFMPCGSRALATAAEITDRRLSEDEKEHLITQQRAITRELDYS